jgi:hypothetical protein
MRILREPVECGRCEPADRGEFPADLITRIHSEQFSASNAK